MLEQPEGGKIQWNQEILIPLQVPLMGSRIVFKVMDEDTVCDEVVGSIMIDAKDYIDDEIVNVPMDDRGKMVTRVAEGMPPVEGERKGSFIPQLDYDDEEKKSSMTAEWYKTARECKNGRFFWKNVYGAPMDCSNKAAANMNENPELGSLWKGRILMQVFAVKTEKPVYKTKDLNEPDNEYSNQFKASRIFRFMAQINSAIALPKEETKYEVVLRVADKEISTGKCVFNKGAYNRFNFRTDTEMATFEAPYLNIDDIGHVFVYLRKKFKLRNKTKDICFFKGHSSDYKNETPEGLTWVQLQPDKAINEVK